MNATPLQYPTPATYALDVEANFIFNISNDPAPSETVTEDGAPSRKTASQDKKRNNSSAFADKFSASMDSGFQLLSKVLAPTEKLENAADDIDNEGRLLEHITNIQRQIQEIGESSISPTKKKRRIDVLNKILDANYDKLDGSV